MQLRGEERIEMEKVDEKEEGAAGASRIGMEEVIKKKKEKRREMSRGEDGGRGRRTVDVGRRVGTGVGLGDSSRVG